MLKTDKQSMDCNTCKHSDSDKCETCYDEILCFPVNPTNWELNIERETTK